jgi:hypothetical protein
MAESEDIMRLGKFSGKVYEESEASNMIECGVCITDEEAKNEEYIQQRHLKDLQNCIGCFGCPMSQNR